MFRYKAIGRNSIIAWALRNEKPIGKTAYKKRNKRVIAKSGPSHVENVRTGKSQHPLNKRMLPFLGTAHIPQSACNSSIYIIIK